MRLRWCEFALLAGLLLHIWGGPLPVYGQTVGTAAPTFKLVTTANDSVSNESLKGQPALVMFWAPWCPVCRKELPILGQFYKTERPQSLRVVSVGFADQRDSVLDYVKTNAETFVFPTAYDEDNRVAETFGVNATPTFVLIDPAGKIVLVHRGGGINQNPQYQQFLKTLKGS